MRFQCWLCLIWQLLLLLHEIVFMLLWSWIFWYIYNLLIPTNQVINEHSFIHNWLLIDEFRVSYHLHIHICDVSAFQKISCIGHISFLIKWFLLSFNISNLKIYTPTLTLHSVSFVIIHCSITISKVRLMR